MCLILTRNVGRSIIIGDDITVTVLAVRGGQVRIGIDAPKEIAVHRSEIWEKLQHEGGNKSFAHDDSEDVTERNGNG